MPHALDAFKCDGPTVESTALDRRIEELGPPAAVFAQRPFERPGWLYTFRQHMAVYFWCGVAAVAAFPRWLLVIAALFVLTLAFIERFLEGWTGY